MRERKATAPRSDIFECICSPCESSIASELVADHQGNDRRARSGGCANGHAGKVRSEDARLVAAESALAGYVDAVGSGVGLKTVVDAGDRGVANGREGVAALGVGRDTQQSVDNAAAGSGGHEARVWPAKVV